MQIKLSLIYKYLHMRPDLIILIIFRAVCISKTEIKHRIFPINFLNVSLRFDCTFYRKTRNIGFVEEAYWKDLYTLHEMYVFLSPIPLHF